MRAGLLARHLRVKIEAYLVRHDGKKIGLGGALPPPCCLPEGGKEPPCWPLPDLMRKPLIKNVLLPMNREISGPQSSFLPESREATAKGKGAPVGAPSTSSPGGCLGLAARKTHRCRAGAVVGLDVDKADHALLDLLPGAQQGRADLLGLFDILGVAAQGLGHLVVTRVAEVAAGLVALG